MKKQSLKIIPKVALLGIIAGVLYACGNGGNASSSYKSISVPTTTYKQTDIQSKFAIYSSAGGGESTLTEIDTGSYFYVIESSHAGSNISYTSESITLYYDHGDTMRSGNIAYTYVTYLDLNGNKIIQTNNQLPIVVVPDGVINTHNDPTKNYAILGMRLNSALSARLYLPYPYNQSYIFDAPESQLVFGDFLSAQLESFGMVSLVSIPCNNGSITTIVNISCWNDAALQVTYTAKYHGQDVESTFNTLFDSGASTNFQFIPIPDWLESTAGVVGNTTLKSLLPTTLGAYDIQLNEPAALVESNFNGGNMVNAGNELFNHYAVFYNQFTGQLGLLGKK